MEERSPEFRAAQHVHHRIVNTVKQEKVPHVRPCNQNRGAITFQPDAPVESYGVTGNRKRAQPKRQDVDGHVECGLDFESVDFRATIHPVKTFRVQLAQRRWQLVVAIQMQSGRIFVQSWDFGKCDENSLRRRLLSRS